MRGKASTMDAKPKPNRITPAYAGKSAVGSSADVGCRDHPRLCGEKHTKDSSEEQKLGSPPPMRGKAFAAGEAV